MGIYTNGVILKRKFEDFAEVEIIKTVDEHTMIKDSNGSHFVLTTKLPEYFDIVEPETIVNKVFEHRNMDDSKRHNIAGSMNGPSETQKEAFKKLDK